MSKPKLKVVHPYLSLEWIAERLEGKIAVGYLDRRFVLATILGASTEVRLTKLEDDVVVTCARKEQQAEVDAKVRVLLELTEPSPEQQPKPDNAAKKRKVTFVRASDVEPENVDWLWDGYLARGSMTILTGDTGLAKSQIAICLIAGITKTGRWPDGTKAPLGSAVILGSEDSLRMTTRPRLEAAGADSERVVCLSAVTNADGTANTFSVQQDLEALAAVLDEIGDVALIVIDPITSYLGSKLDSHKTTEVRAALEPLCGFAEKHNVAILLITHPTKAVQAKAIHMAIGSGAFVHLPRVGFVAIPDPDEPPDTRRLLLPMFNNIGVMAPGLGYRTEPVRIGPNKDIKTSRVAWDGVPVSISADGALAKTGGTLGGGFAIKDAKTFLQEKLANGPVPTADVEDEAKALGISVRTLNRARSELGVKAVKHGFEGGWHLKLPDIDSAVADLIATAKAKAARKGANGKGATPEG